MKIFVLIGFFMVLMFTGCGSSQPARETVEQTLTSGSYVKISFAYQKLSGFASNQIAVWVEDEQGKFIKAVYATQWTAKGGYQKRPNSILNFVRQSGLEAMTAEQIDAFSGATPQTGNLSYIWDLTDANGNKVADGKYTLYLEGTLRNDNNVLYQTQLIIGGDALETQPSPQYSVQETADREMLGNVTITYVKK